MGELNIAFPDRLKHSRLDLDFLTSLGPQLGVAIENARLWEEVRRKDAMRAELLKKVVGKDGHRLPYEVETITNVARHAQTDHARVMFEFRAGSVVAIIEDAGRGFNVEKTLSSPHVRERLNLYSMEERAALIGGKLEIESAPGKGTTLFVQVPFRMAPDPDGASA